MLSFDYLAAPGQLGNQMFKYAALRGIAENNDYDFLVPPSKYFIEKNKQLNKLYRKFFSYSYQNHLLFKYFEMRTVPKDNIKFSKFKESQKPISHMFDEELFNNCADNIQLNGFYQSPKYFMNVEETIREDFKFKKQIIKKGNKLFLDFKPTCTVHIRRGDYLTNPNHFALDLDYYYEAAELLDKDTIFAIFTDDINWFNSNDFFKKKNFILFSELTKKSTILDLYLMSLCKNHIISNSTFSWWGAWLSEPNKVIYPINWFMDGRSSADIPCESWVGIKNKLD